MKQTAHVRLLYAVIVVLFTCLLVTAGAYSRLKQEREAATDRLDAITLRIANENVRLDADIARERGAVRDAFGRLSEWEALYPQQAEASRQRAVKKGLIVPEGREARTGVRALSNQAPPGGVTGRPR